MLCEFEEKSTHPRHYCNYITTFAVHRFELMIVAVYSRDLSKGLSKETFLKVVTYLEGLSAEIIVHESVVESLISTKISFEHFKVFSHFTKDSEKIPDLLISIGGDGTILDTLMIVRDTGIPVLGINTGRLGFLAAISPENVEKAIDAYMKGAFVIDERTVLELKTSKEFFTFNYALNDFVINKRDSSSMIKVHTYLNGEYFNSYWADGLICSTPTGSTGYNLSCGGAILHPKSESFAITPIAPHNLNVRPFVIPDDHILAFEVEGRSTAFLASLDARSVSITQDTQIAVKKADFRFNLARLKGENFMTTLRNKMMWGLDARN